MDKTKVLAEFEAAGAILRGHFILSSGLRSDTYLQCARVLMDAARAGRLCAALADKVRDACKPSAKGPHPGPLPGGEGGLPFDLVVSPAMGGVVVGYEMGRQLGIPAIFVERVEGKFAVRRGFEIPAGARVLVVEDVVTTGLSSRETFDCIRAQGGNVVAEAALVDRSGGKADLGVPLAALLTLDVATYSADALPPALAAIPAVKPGSRGVASS